MSKIDSASTTRIRIGTRGSPLAKWQAEWVAARLRETGVEVELILITTGGDRQQQGPIGAIGTQGVFTKEIQRALLDRHVDLAVHSLKDLPTERVEGLMLAAVPPRAPAEDVLVSRWYGSLEDLRQEAVVGTGSLRRRAQLAHLRPDLKMLDVRGNVDTRLRKLDEGQYDALVLARAGLMRLDLAKHITQILPLPTILPAVGQGALGLETRSDDAASRDIVSRLDDPTTHAAVLAERAMLATLRGGCLAPVAAWSRMEGESLTLTGRVLSLDGRRKIEAHRSGSPTQAEELGAEVARELLGQGAAELIQAARGGETIVN
jgi:hydroxymethylbilane synthase